MRNNFKCLQTQEKVLKLYRTYAEGQIQVKFMQPDKVSRRVIITKTWSLVIVIRMLLSTSKIIFSLNKTRQSITTISKIITYLHRIKLSWTVYLLFHCFAVMYKTIDG